ncbi:MAG: G/U mismatch-specific DNA glycosylase [Acidimicrobiales bacterium]
MATERPAPERRAAAGRAPPSPGVRPSPADLAAAVALGRTVPDVIGPDLGVLFCGINPGRWSGAAGHHFAHPGNRFWKLLHAAGLTPEILGPAEERRLLDCGLGVTNLVARTTATAAELDPVELRAGAARLAVKVGRWRPAVVAVLGLGAFRTAFGRRGAAVGEQAEPLGSAALWVVANPSGLQGHYRFDDMAAELRRLCPAAARGREARAACDGARVGGPRGEQSTT